jgi:hypothetical protein
MLLVAGLHIWACHRRLGHTELAASIGLAAIQYLADGPRHSLRTCREKRPSVVVGIPGMLHHEHEVKVHAEVAHLYCMSEFSGRRTSDQS